MAIKNYKDLDPNKVKQSIEKFWLERTKWAIWNAWLLPKDPVQDTGLSWWEQIDAKWYEEPQVKIPDVNQYTPKSTVWGKIKIPWQDTTWTTWKVDTNQDFDVDSQWTFQEEYAKWEMDNKLRDERARIEKEEWKAVDTKLKEFERGASNYEKNRWNYTNYNKVNDLYNSVRDAKIELYKEFWTSELTDEQNQTLADRFWVDINNIKDSWTIFEDNLILSEEWKKNTWTTKFDQWMADADTNFRRTKEDMKTNLQNMKDDTELAIDWVQENIDRNVQFATAQWAWTGWLRSSWYAQGIKNIKDDGQKIINKLSTSLERYEGTDTTNLERLTEDYNKWVQRATDEFNSQIKDIKYNAGLQLSGLTDKYWAWSEALTEALNDIAKEYQSMDMAAVWQFQQLLRNEQIRTNAAIDLYDKEQELVNGKLNVRFNEYLANDAELLQNTNLTTLANEVTAWTLSQAKLTDLKNIMTNSIQTVLGKTANLTTDDIAKVNTLLSEWNTPAQVVAEMRTDERFTQTTVADWKTYQDWAKYDDNFLYNQRTWEFKSAITWENVPKEEATNISAEQAKLDTYTLNDWTQITATKWLVDWINAIMDTNSDIQFDISNLYRTQEDQYALYGQGRTAEELTAAWIDASYAQPEENIVTWTTNSPHMEWNAVDVVLPEWEDKVKYFEWIDAEMNKNWFFRPEETIARWDYGHYEFRGIDEWFTDSQVSLFKNLWNKWKFDDLSEMLWTDLQWAKDQYNKWKETIDLSVEDRVKLKKMLFAISGKQTSEEERQSFYEDFVDLREAWYDDQWIIDRFAWYYLYDTNEWDTKMGTALDKFKKYTYWVNTDLPWEVSEQINNGNYQGAMNIIEDARFKRKWDENPVTEVQWYMGTYDKMTEWLEKYEDRFWPIEGWKSEMVNTYITWDSDFQEMLWNLALYVAEYRNKISGTAVTESESKFLDNVIPSIRDNPEKAFWKIDVIMKKMTRDYNIARKNAWLPEINNEEIRNNVARLEKYTWKAPVDISNTQTLWSKGAAIWAALWTWRQVNGGDNEFDSYFWVETKEPTSDDLFDKYY